MEEQSAATLQMPDIGNVTPQKIVILTCSNTACPGKVVQALLPVRVLLHIKKIFSSSLIVWLT
jgi:hypothetical protein